MARYEIKPQPAATTANAPTPRRYEIIDTKTKTKRTIPVQVKRNIAELVKYACSKEFEEEPETN